MTAFETLAEEVRRENDPRARVDALIAGLAGLIKASSNDQNVQRLARDLRGAATRLGDAMDAPSAVAR